MSNDQIRLRLLFVFYSASWASRHIHVFVRLDVKGELVTYFPPSEARRELTNFNVKKNFPSRCTLDHKPPQSTNFSQNNQIRNFLPIIKPVK